MQTNGTLFIQCFDTIEVSDHTTFGAYMYGDRRIIHWHEPTGREAETIANMFDLLFEETERLLLEKQKI